MQGFVRNAINRIHKNSLLKCSNEILYQDNSLVRDLFTAKCLRTMKSVSLMLLGPPVMKGHHLAPLTDCRLVVAKSPCC